MKICVAVPVYDGRLHVQFVRALLAEQIVAHGVGDQIQYRFLGGNAGIVQGRNQLAHEFMESDDERLIFLDSDITFEPGAIVALAHKPADVVGGAYRFKMADKEESYPIRFLPDPDLKGLWANQHGLIEVESLPTGFLAINRNVFEAFTKQWPERVQSHLDHISYTYFQMPFHEGIAYGEDYYFCKEWRELGGKVFLDPEIRLTHWSFAPTPFEGHIGNWLKNRSGLPTEEETHHVEPVAL